MNIRVSIDKIDIHTKTYVLSDELELMCLLDDEQVSLSRSKAESLFEIDRGDVDEETGEDCQRFDETWEELAMQFQLRQDVIKEYYPFYFREGTLTKKNGWGESIQHRLYLNFLVASQLKFLNCSEQQLVARDFEKFP